MDRADWGSGGRRSSATKRFLTNSRLATSHVRKEFTLTDLLRQSVYRRLAGYEDLNDDERLAADQKVGGSNPLAPTILFPLKTNPFRILPCSRSP
jgi:hypothetical protein